MNTSSNSPVNTPLLQAENEPPFREFAASKSLSPTFRLFLLLGALMVIALMIWQGLTAAGAPDPLAQKSSRQVAVFDIAVLVFREGLECVLVLAAITASMTGANSVHKRPIAWGAAAAFVASWLTWFIVVRIVENVGENMSALALQAGTGLMAVIVLLVVMNWFFHKVYWGGWITLHNRKKKALLSDEDKSHASQVRLYWGLGLLGFSSLYREGFEIVLFLQNYNLKLGGAAVFQGTMIGLFLSAIVAILTFVAHHKLPYRKMLIFTGIMLGGVLLVMVGEQAQEMQLAHWISTSPVQALKFIPEWMGLWFAVFPTVETLTAQALAAFIVIGSYFLAKGQSHESSRP